MKDSSWRSRREDKKTKEKVREEKWGRSVIKSSLIIHYTHNSELARRVKEDEFTIEKMSDWSLKVVEMARR